MAQDLVMYEQICSRAKHKVGLIKEVYCKINSVYSSFLLFRTHARAWWTRLVWCSMHWAESPSKYIWHRALGAWRILNMRNRQTFWQNLHLYSRSSVVYSGDWLWPWPWFHLGVYEH